MSTQPSKSWKTISQGDPTGQECGASEARRHVLIRLPDVRKSDVADSLAAKLVEPSHASLRVGLAADDEQEFEQPAVSLTCKKTATKLLGSRISAGKLWAVTAGKSVAKSASQIPWSKVRLPSWGQRRPSPLVLGLLGGCAVTMMSLGLLSFFAADDSGPIVSKQEPMAWKVEPPVTMTDADTAEPTDEPDEAPTVVSPSMAVVPPPGSMPGDAPLESDAGESNATSVASTESPNAVDRNGMDRNSAARYTPVFGPRPGLARFQGFIENIPPIAEARNEPDRPGLH